MIGSELQRWLARARGALASSGEQAVVPETSEHAVIDQLYRCGIFDIELPHDHLLPRYQREHRLYDRFLSFLSGYLPHGCIVIDVGANVGDTFASMISRNKSLKFCCVEPDPVFFDYLNRNVDAICAASASIPHPVLLQAFVGAEPIKGKLVSANGSAHVVEDDSYVASEIKYVSLSTILKNDFDEAMTSAGQQVFIKSDVDGFDYNVIESLGGWLDSGRIDVFFECQVASSDQYSKYLKALQLLASNDFIFSAFDNFGNVMAVRVGLGVIADLLAYVWRQECGTSTRTIWYIDVLASRCASKGYVDRAVDDFVVDPFSGD